MPKHCWNLSETEALELQSLWAKQVIKSDQFSTVRTVAGLDVAYDKESSLLVAAIVVLDVSTFEVLESVSVTSSAQFPYIPGLFSFRELPPLIEAFHQLKHRPDLVICDGHGIAHPRRFGLASHFGVYTNLPTIGCGKTRLIGEFIEPNQERGSSTQLLDKFDEIGATLRTQTNVKPIFVSIGHLISLKTACLWTLQMSPMYRLPEPIRSADQLARQQLSKGR